MSYVMTAKHRASQAELIRNGEPWEHSTGPRTPEGKEHSSRNAFRGGWREELRELMRLLAEQKEVVDVLKER